MNILNRSILLISFFIISWQCAENGKIRIHLIGDSTMADKPLEDNPERGWGQMFPEFFSDKVVIHNYAVNGRSSKSFIDEGRWQTILDSLYPGDYLFIQFGHNDEKSHDSTRYTAPNGAYKANLEKFVFECRSKGAIPVLLTPIVRRRFNENGKFYDTHGDYPDAVREVAIRLEVPLIDMHKLSRDLVILKGEQESKQIFLWVEPGKYHHLPDGKQDNTHFSESGATMMAGLVAKALSDIDLAIKDYLVEK